MKPKLPTISDYTQIFLENRPLLDLRAPVEFAEGAFPNATNIPLLTDDERHQVGIAYKQKGQDAAIAHGYELVDDTEKQKRIVQWTDFVQARPNALLYCFRGGLRSRLTQQMLAEEAGIVVPRIVGGYKQMRRFLIDQMSLRAPQVPLIRLGGRTGVGKTALLHTVPRSIDLEGEARHKGSAFGREVEPQPTQINIDNQLSIQLIRLMKQSEQAPILIEDEGSKIGARHISRPLWHAMEQAPVIVLEATQEERIEQSLNDYVLTMLNDYRRILPDEATAQQALREHIVSSLNRVQKRLGGLRHRAFMALADEALNQFCESQTLDGLRLLIGKLLIEYYDPMYDYQLGKKHNRILFSGNQSEIQHWLTEQGFTITSG